MHAANSLPKDLEIFQKFYASCTLVLSNLKLHAETNDYAACSFELNAKKIIYRASKITPKKIGQFVAIWKRDASGVTRGYDVADDFDFVIISSKEGDSIGQFVFPKALLLAKGIVSHNAKPGKRGIRVYPPWSQVTSKQAMRTQAWQLEYFTEIKNTGDISFMQDLFI